MPDIKIEEIGKIKLNLTHYPGEDYYSDGDVEDELLDITRNYAAVEYGRIIEERKSWPILYHLSPLRENIVEWLPITKDMKVLEVGSGCGAITGALAKKAGEVTCIDLSGKRSRINAYRHTDADNITIHVGNFQDVEPDLPCDYDYICLIGVFEYAQAYIRSETPYEDFLNIIKRHVKAEGHVAIAIENKFGLKYWAGCKEDHLGTWFSGLENYPDGGVVRTFTADGLREIAARCGYQRAQMYYPYPDYKFMTCLYSDERLPKTGELSSNLRNFDRDRLQLFDEKKVFDTIIQENQFPLFSNSYMMLLGPVLEEKYVKFSNDRVPEFRIKTVLRENASGKTIEKHPLCKEAHQHIRQTADIYEKLSKRYAGSGLSVNRSQLKEGQDPYLSLEYIEGKTLEQIMDECLDRNDVDGFHSLFDEYLKRISVGEESEVADYDLIFANIIVPSNDKSFENDDNNVCNDKNDNGRYLHNVWNVIDCEWSFEKSVETKQIAFRALYCYLLENEKRNTLNFDLILEKLNLDQFDAEQYRKQEMSFQKYVTGKNMSMAEIRDAIGYPVYTVEEFCEAQEMTKHNDRFQIYEDTGKGFREEQSFFPDENMGEQLRITPEGVTELEIRIAGGRSALRIDPCSDFCMIYIREIKWNGILLSWKGKQIQTNGFSIGENTYVFPTRDPNITISLAEAANEESNLLQMAMEVTRLPEETVKHIRKRGLF